MTMPREAKREFLDLDVSEISLVDEPANETPVAVMKRKAQEHDEMANKVESKVSKSKGDAQEPASGDDTEQVQVEVDKSLSEDVVTALKAIAEHVQKANASGDDDEDADGSASDDSDDVKKAKAKKTWDNLKKDLEKAGLKGDALQKAMALFKAFGESGFKDIKKSEGEPTDEAAVVKATAAEEAQMQVLETLSEAVAKAKKFTPKRLAALKDAVTKLSTLLSEVETDKASFGASGLTVTPTSSQSVGSLIDQSTSGGGYGSPANTIKKDADASPIADAIAKALEPIAKAIAPLTETVNELKGEIESIKKSRAPATATETNEPEAVEKSKAKFWSGVL